MIPSKKVRSLALALSCAASGCATAPQVQPKDPPEPPPCPAGVAETYRQYLKGDWSQKGVRLSPRSEGNLPVTVRDGQWLTTYLLVGWGALPDLTPFAGRVQFGKERVYVRLVDVLLPSGQHAPICLDLDFNGLGIPMYEGHTRKEASITMSATAIIVDAKKFRN